VVASVGAETLEVDPAVTGFSGEPLALPGKGRGVGEAGDTVCATEELATDNNPRMEQPDKKRNNKQNFTKNKSN